MNNPITDLHIHIVPKVDDGARDITMSLDMLQMAYDEGARNIFCTSHNVYTEEEIKRYKAQFMTLQMCAKMRFPDLKLHTGCELLCAGDYIDDILYGLAIGVFLPLGDSKCILTELYPDVTPDEAKKVVKTLINAGWLPIIAHSERYPDLYDGKTIEELVNLGVKIQVNLFSLQEEQNEELKNRARYLIENKFAHFVGSDAHRSNHRPPKYKSGIEYLRKICSEDYFEDLCYKNAEKYIKVSS